MVQYVARAVNHDKEKGYQEKRKKSNLYADSMILCGTQSKNEEI